MVLAALALAGVVLALVVHAVVMPHTTGNADEVVYRFQAQMYRDGMLTIADDGPVFRPWMSGVVDGERLMVFPPGWPALLALGLLVTGSTAVAAALVMGALGPAAWWFAREATGDRRVAAVAGAVLLASPVVVVHSGTLLSYLPALSGELIVAATVVRAVRTGRLRVLAVGGLALGVVFSMRPLDAVLLAVVLGGYAAVAWRRDLRRLLAAAGWGALGAVLPVISVLAYNARVTGSPATFPIEAAGGNNAFGFGPRNIAAGTPVVDVTLIDQLRAAARNLMAVGRFGPAAWLGLPLVVVGAVALWRTGRDGRRLFGMLVAIVVVFPLTYVFYWGSLLVLTGSDTLGPFYYLALWIPLSLLVALGGVALWDRATQVPSAAQGGRRARTVAAAGAVGVALVGLALTAVVLRAPLDTFERYTARADTQLAAVAGLAPGALVVLPVAFDGPWILSPWNQYANEPRLGGDVIYAADAGAPVVDALDRFADRRAFALLAPDGPGNAGPLALEALTVRRAPAFTVETRLRRLPVGTPAWAYAATPATGVRCRVEGDAAGDAVVRWSLVGDRLTAEGCTGPLEAWGPTPLGQRPCAFGSQVGEGSALVLRDERLWCRAPAGPGDPAVLVTPGEPRVARPTADGTLAWAHLTRADADADLVVTPQP